MDLTTIGIALMSAVAVAVVAGAVFGTRQAAKITANASGTGRTCATSSRNSISQAASNLPANSY
jgi:hypothetical protein